MAEETTGMESTETQTEQSESFSDTSTESFEVSQETETAKADVTNETSDESAWTKLEEKWRDNPHAMDKATDEEWELYQKWGKGTLGKKEEDNKEVKESEKPQEKKPSLLESLKQKVGAKTDEEILAKVEGLTKAISDKRQNFAAERDQAKAQADNFGKALEENHKLLIGVLQGDENARARAWQIAEKAGIKASEKVNQPKGKIDRDSLADPELYDELMEAREEIKMVKSFYERQNEEIANKQALASIEDEMVEVATEFDDYGITGAEVRKLFQQWVKTKQIPEHLKPLNDLMRVADEKRISLKDAHKLLYWDKRGTAAVNSLSKTKQPLNAPNLSANVKQSNNSGRYSEAQLRDIANGKMDNPWSKDGVVMYNKIPEYARDYLKRHF